MHRILSTNQFPVLSFSSRVHAIVTSVNICWTTYEHWYPFLLQASSNVLLSLSKERSPRTLCQLLTTSSRDNLNEKKKREKERENWKRRRRTRKKTCIIQKPTYIEYEKMHNCTLSTTSSVPNNWRWLHIHIHVAIRARVQHCVHYSGILPT